MAALVPCTLAIIATPLVIYLIDPPGVKDTPEAPIAVNYPPGGRFSPKVGRFAICNSPAGELPSDSKERRAVARPLWRLSDTKLYHRT
eukprot:7090227-Pyramimonas_sp.AAC.1